MKHTIIYEGKENCQPGESHPPAPPLIVREENRRRGDDRARKIEKKCNVEMSREAGKERERE